MKKAIVKVPVWPLQQKLKTASSSGYNTVQSEERLFKYSA